MEVEKNDRDEQPSARGLLSGVWTESWWKFLLVIAAALFIGLGGVRLMWVVARPLAIVFIAVTIAAALAPVARWLGQWLPYKLGVVLIYLVLLLLLVLLGWMVVPDLIGQAQQFIDNLPSYMDSLRQFMARQNISTGEAVDTFIAQLQRVGTGLITTPLAVFSGLLDIVLVFIISLYLLLEIDSIERFWLSLFPERAGDRVERVTAEMLQATGGFVRGVVIDAVIVGILTYIGLRIIGVQFALILAIMTAFLEVLPILGAIIAGLIATFVALLQSPTTALITLIFYTILQQIEGNILVPNIMQEQANVPAALVQVAVFIGGAIGGVIGALVAVPLTAMLRVFFLEVLAPRIRRETGAV